jgi:death-on-curing protein
VTEAIQLHGLVLEIGGGSAGLRDQSLLESALAKARSYFVYDKQQDLFMLAAVYGEGIARNHAFVDGNKRTAFQVMVYFLEKNGWILLAEENDEFVDMMVDLGQGIANYKPVAAMLKRYSEQSLDFQR